MPRKFGQRPVVGTEREALEALRRGLTINQGKAPKVGSEERGDSHRMRVYVKTHDTIGGVAYALMDTKQHCARSERTLLDEQVPFTTINEWRNFRFETLARRFELVVPAIFTKLLAQQLQQRVVQHGLCLDNMEKTAPVEGAMAMSRSATYRRTKRPGSRADTATNSRIRSALKCLTLRGRVKIRKETGAAVPLSVEGNDNILASGPEYSKTNTIFHITQQSMLTSEAEPSGHQAPITLVAAQPEMGYEQCMSNLNHHDPPGNANTD